MADDINVVFGADTTQLDAAVSKVKSEMQSLTPGAPGSGILTPLPQAFGGAPSTLLERATAAAKANAAAAAQAGTAMKNFARAEDEAGEAAGRAGVNVGNMVQRMVVRMALLEVAFKAVEAAGKEMWSSITAPGNLEAATNRFEALSTAGADFSKELAIADEVSRKTGTDIKELYGPILKLEDAAVAPEQLGDALTAVAEAARTSGVPLEHIADLAAKVKLHEASVPQMRELARLSGEFKDSSMESVSYLEAQAKMLPIIEQQEQAAARAAEQFDAAQQRQTDRQMSLFEKLAAAQKPGARTDYMKEWKEAQRQETINQSWYGAGGVAGTPYSRPMPISQAPDMARLLEFGGMVGGMRVPQEAMAQYKRGLEEIAQLEGTNTAIVRAQVQAKTIGYQDVMQAGREAAQDEIRAIRESEQAQRTANRETAETSRLSAGAEIFENFKKANAQATEFEKHLQTIQGFQERFQAGAQRFKEQQGLWAPEALGVVTPGPAPWAPGGKITESNSDKIESHLSDLLEIFRSH